MPTNSEHDCERIGGPASSQEAVDGGGDLPALHREPEASAARRITMIKALCSLASAVNHNLPFPELAELALDALHRAIPVQMAGVALLEGDGTLRLASSRGVPESCRLAIEGQRPWPSGTSDAQPVFLSASTRGSSAGDMPACVLHEGVKALTFVPVALDHGVLGSLVFGSSGGDVCGDEELEFAVAVATHLALALDRRRMEEALLAEQQRFVMTAEGAPFGLVAIGSDGRFIFVNAAFVRITGYSLADVPNREMWRSKAYPDPVYRRQVVETWLDDTGVRRPNGGWRRSFWVTCKDGSRKLMEFNATPLEYGAWVKTCEDITGRTAQDQQVRLLAHAVRSVNECVSITDQDDRIIYVNEAFQRTFGYTMAELVGRTSEVLRAPSADPRLIAEIYPATLAGGWSGELPNITREGREFTVHLSASVVRDEHGSVLGLIGVCSDVSEEKRAEAARLEVEARYRTLAESSPDIIFIVDSSGRVRYVNATAARLLGARPDEIVGRRQEELFPAGQAAHHHRVLRRAFETGEMTGGETVVRGASGDVWLDSRIVPLAEPTGVVREVMGISRDTTERHLAERRLHEREEQLRQAQKMEAVGRLAGGVAHDFNNLLQALLSNLQVLRVRQEPERVGDSLEELEALVKRGAALTRQLLLFSRRDTPRTERVDLNDTVLEVSRMLRRLVRENIHIRLDMDEEPLRIDADRGQVGQVLINLALNASDAMPEGGELTLRTARLGDLEVSLEVVDTGVGIPDEQQEKIFEPFFTTKSSGQGTGLGLSVVQGIVSEHGGRIELDSAPGQGSTFRVVLPGSLTDDAPEIGHRETSIADATARQSARILVVEDEIGAREALVEILLLVGFSVTAVASAEEAVALPPTSPFDVLLTDVLLPGMPGDRLAATLHERWPALAVILMSGYTQNEDLRQEVRGGALRFLQKPFDMDTLTREIAAALGRPVRVPACGPAG